MFHKELILSLTNISFGYQDNSRVINDVSFKLWSGDRVGLLGANGAGKTTLFLTIAGVKKISSGEVMFMDQIIQQGKFQPDIGMVFQDANDQLFCPTVYEDIAFGLRNMSLPENEIENRVNKALISLGIEKLKNKPPHHLSGGEKRLVAIAGIVAMESTLVLYDEPTSNLDMGYRRKLIDFMLSANAKGMLIASHDLEFILEVCNRVMIIEDGQIVIDGEPKVIMSNKELMEQYGLEIPYSLRYLETHSKNKLLKRIR